MADTEKWEILALVCVQIILFSGLIQFMHNNYPEKNY